MAAHASHGRYFFLRPNATDPLGNVFPGVITHDSNESFDVLS
jgi:hypothetical protein